MARNIPKKSVDSVKKRKTRQSFVLDAEKNIKKQLGFGCLTFENKTEKKSMENSSTNSLQFLKVPMNLSSARNSAMKITAAILIVSLNWLGISAIGKTTAYFIDSEISQGNTFSAGTLDFSLTSPTESFVPQDECDELGEDGDNDNSNDDSEEEENDDSDNDEQGQNNNEVGNNGNGTVKIIQTTLNNGSGETENAISLAREIQIKNEGNMAFQYVPTIKDISNNGNIDFCDNLMLRAELDGEAIGPEKIADFDFNNRSFVIDENGQDVWNFTISSLPNDGENDEENGNENSNEEQSCQFVFSFSARQVDLDSEYGFGAEKEIQNTVEINSSGGSNGDDNHNCSENDGGENNNDGNSNNNNYDNNDGETDHNGIGESEDTQHEDVEDNKENENSYSVQYLNGITEVKVDDETGEIVEVAQEHESGEREDGNNPEDRNGKKDNSENPNGNSTDK